MGAANDALLQHGNDGRSNDTQENPSKPQHTAQRIFIGGLHPPNLTVEMVQKRIKASFEEKLDLLSFDSRKTSKHLNAWGEDSRTFFFLTAKLKSSEEQSITPLELISKQYHKVKWKGCSLQVEPAKLHFLQRLEIERIEAKKEEEEQQRIQKRREEEHQQQQDIEMVDTIVGSHQDKNTNAKKRHLRIRKQHGEEAYMVDTKPIETKDWEEVMYTVKKQRIKYQKHAEKLTLSRSEKKAKRNDDSRNANKIRSTSNNLSLQSKVFLNRAVHFHFGDNNTGELNFKGDHSQELLTKSKMNSISSNETSTESSDEREDSKEGTDMIVSDDELNTSMDEDPGVVDDKTEKLAPSQKTTNSKEEYEWSDSDDDSDSDDNGNYKPKMSKNLFTQSTHNALDEFASAVQDELQNDYIEKVNSIDEEMEERIEFSSLEDDVISNLHLLKKMFPDINVRSRNESVDGKEETKHVKPGWNPTGIMQRYDPTADSSIKYEIKNDEIEDSKNDSQKRNEPEINNSEDDHDDDSDNDSKDLSSEPENSDEEISTTGDQRGEKIYGNPKEEFLKPTSVKDNDDGKVQIYEQKKLENIFQQQRSGGGTTNFQLSSLFQFDLKEENEEAARPSEKEDSTKNFSFSFDTSNVDEKMTESSKNTERLANTGADDTKFSSNENTGQIGEGLDNSPNKRSSELKDRHGLFYSSEDLNIFEQNFFNMNEGVDGILHMMDNRSKSEADQSQWQEERKTLTLDWKRKLKYAQSRRSKKLKFR